MKELTHRRQELPENRLCEYMARFGFSNRAIRDFIGLSDSQIQRVCRESGIKRIHYRDALMPLPQQIIRKLDALAEQQLITHLEKYLLKGGK